MFLLLEGIWLILNNSLSLQVVISGAVIALVIAVVFCANCTVFREIRFHPRAILYTIAYLFVFFWELVKANVDMAIRILKPSLPINPGVIKAHISLKSEMARLILANSITLTPGTFTLDIIENDLYIHCVNLGEGDPEELGKNIVRKFEKYLEVIYG